MRQSDNEARKMMRRAMLMQQRMVSLLLTFDK